MTWTFLKKRRFWRTSIRTIIILLLFVITLFVILTLFFGNREHFIDVRPAFPSAEEVAVR